MARTGRPKLPKREHTVMVSVRLKPATIKAMDALAKKWNCSKAQAITRLIEQESK